MKPQITMDTKLQPDHLLTLIDAEFREVGAAGSHFESFNRLLDREGLKSIITEQYDISRENIPNERDTTEEDKQIKSYSYKVTFLDVDIRPPTKTTYNSGRKEPMFPNDARINNSTYKSVIHGHLRFEATAYLKNGTTKSLPVRELRNVELGNIPILVKSNLCNLKNATRQELIAAGEDPTDPGGYLIIGGLEKAIVSIESNSLNSLQIYKSKDKHETVRGEFMSKPGDAFENSYQMKIYLTDTDHIYIDLVFSRDKPLRIPFYLLFRLYGITSDRKIIELIAYDLNSDDPAIKTIISKLERAMVVDYKNTNFDDIKNVVYDTQRLNRFFYNQLKDKELKQTLNNDRFINEEVSRYIDKNILPHMGTEPDHRYVKAMFLGHMINELFQAESGGIPLTDRDTYGSKAGKLVFTAGSALARAFKPHFNFTIIQPAKIAFNTAFREQSFSNIKMDSVFKSAIKTADLENFLVKAIKSGLKEIKVGSVKTQNRISSNNLERSKNETNVICMLRGISTSAGNTAKGSERSHKIRSYHASAIPYIDPNHTVEGGDAGLMKQPSLMTSITESSSSSLLKKIIFDQPKDSFGGVDKLQDIVLADIYGLNLSKVFVNGEWIGCTSNPFEFANFYRLMRRKKKIHIKTSIFLDVLTLNVYFLTTRGLLTRPVIIVKNNGKFDKDFKQWISITRQDCLDLLKNKKKTMDLVNEEKVEYISASEQDNCFIAQNLNVLRQEENNYLKVYTHCDIDQALYGLAGLSSPFMNCEPPNRVSFQTKQVRQSTSWYAKNWFNRFDKLAFMQLELQMPISKTMVNKYYTPIGYNSIVALMCYDGQNQEDSMNMNKASADRGLFAGAYYTYFTTYLETDEVFKNPDITNTRGIKQGSYNNLVEGKIQVGTRVEHGDVLIGKVYCPSGRRKTDNMCQDRSVIYTKHEPAIVDKVVIGYDEKDHRFCKVRTVAYRQVQSGDKFAARSSNKSVVSVKNASADFPFCENGLIPDFILNTHSIPTRMVANQSSHESLCNLLWAYQGIIGDATAHRPVDIHDTIRKLKDRGIEWKGTQTMYNGETGQKINTPIFVCPVYYQRVKKFIMDENGVGTRGRVNPLTDQPVGGIYRDGALRIGEMEAVCLYTSGATYTLSEKLYNDSDGKILPICRVCKRWAVLNKRENIYYCKNCQNDGHIVEIRSGTTNKLVMDHCNGAGIDTTFNVSPLNYVKYE